jgi:putative chitinase
MDQALFGAALMRLWPHGDSRIPGLRSAMIDQLSALYSKCDLTPIALADMMGRID